MVVGLLERGGVGVRSEELERSTVIMSLEYCVAVGLDLLSLLSLVSLWSAEFVLVAFCVGVIVRSVLLSLFVVEWWLWVCWNVEVWVSVRRSWRDRP